MRRLALFAVLGAVACSSPTAPTPEAPIGQPVTLRPGSSLTIQGTNITFSFRQVVSDSRCPLDVVCIHAGEAVVAFGIASGSTAVFDQLSTSATQPFQYGDYRIRLVHVDPYPRTTVTIPPGDYRATFLITTQ